MSLFTLAKDFRDVVVSLRVPGMANLPIDCPEKKTLIHLAKPSLINKSPPTMFSWHALYYFAVRKLYADVCPYATVPARSLCRLFHFFLVPNQSEGASHAFLCDFR